METIDFDVEVTVRPLRKSSDRTSGLNQVMDMIKNTMYEKNPNIAVPINESLRALAGLSSQRKARYVKYADKEILKMFFL